MKITPAERAVLQLRTDGKSTADIAERLGISQSAVEAMLMSVLDRMGTAGQVEAATSTTRHASLDSDGTRRGPPALADGEEAAGAN